MIKILIVDDEPVKAQWIRDDCLLGYDCEIEIATSYLSAVGKLRDNKYHLVISDENLPDDENNMLGAGHVLKKYHLAEHPECRFILYTADPELVENKDVRADCVAYGDHLRTAIHNAIYLMCQPKTEEEKPQVVPMKNGEIMPNPVKVNWSLLISAAAFAATLFVGYGTYAVTTYKVNTTDTKVASHCTANDIDKEKTASRFNSVELATARLEEQTKNLTDAVKALTTEIRKSNRKLEPY
jgi:CheY-like chemotaxis protein